jgi:Predicted metal-dependent hydrolase
VSEFFDISRPLAKSTAPWPGDTPCTFDLNWKMSEGAAVNVGAITISVHSGTHADAPFHFEKNGTSVDRLPLQTFLGPAVVVDLSPIFSSGTEPREISIADLEPCARDLTEAPRLLIKTGRWRDSAIFPIRIPVLADAVPAWLRARGVILLGVDLPSVDAIDSKDLSNHHGLAEAGIAIVESLDLAKIKAGRYNFAALPLKITGADAAPARAILWRE